MPTATSRPAIRLQRVNASVISILEYPRERR
jgi:hypothetical protein